MTLDTQRLGQTLLGISWASDLFLQSLCCAPFKKRDLLEKGETVLSLRATESPQHEKAQETARWSEQGSYSKGPGAQAWFERLQ